MKTCLTKLCTLLWMVLAAASSALAAVPEPGMLLVAREALPDVRFREAVVLLVQSDPQGSAGLILNRPSRLPLDEVLPGLPAGAGRQGTLSYGGPVASGSLMVLVKSPDLPPDPAQKVVGRTYLTGPEQLSAWLAGGHPGAVFRVFTGYAGWAPGQLEGEVGRGDWQVLTADEKILFAGDAERLWRELATKGAGVTSPPPVGGD